MHPLGVVKRAAVFKRNQNFKTMDINFKEPITIGVEDLSDLSEIIKDILFSHYDLFEALLREAEESEDINGWHNLRNVFYLKSDNREIEMFYEIDELPNEYFGFDGIHDKAYGMTIATYIESHSIYNGKAYSSVIDCGDCSFLFHFHEGNFYEITTTSDFFSEKTVE